jgi:UDP-N-acetylmuramyl pentapeptide synthase
LILIDETYNANPVSMRAALSLLGEATPADGGRRIAVLGDMLELGPQAAAMHRELAEAVAQHGIDLLFAAGPLMLRLYEAVSPAIQGLWGEQSADIEAAVLAAVQGGDVVMIKGSNGSRMGSIVRALKQHFEHPARPVDSKQVLASALQL